MKDSVRPDYLTDEQVELFGRLADRVVNLGFALPAVLFLETMRPVNFIGSQVMLFFHPMLRSFFTLREYDLLQQALERRESMGYFVDIIEERDLLRTQKEREWKAQLKAEKRAKKEAKKAAKRKS